MDYVRFSFILHTFHTVNYGPRMLFIAYHANQVNPSSNRLVTIFFITPRVSCNALYATDISNGIVFQQQQLHISTGSKVNPIEWEQSRNTSPLGLVIHPNEK